jgi:enoyl-CoA hydratase/3-hydroxyacyl-CoA dehydrogenase
MRNLKNIEYFNEKNVTWIRLNRPEKLNALNEETWLELKESVIKANTEKTNLICITGNGRAFSAGDDIQSMYQFKDLSESKNFFNKLKDTIMAIVESEKPIMFAVNWHMEEAVNYYYLEILLFLFQMLYFLCLNQNWV